MGRLGGASGGGARADAVRLTAFVLRRSFRGVGFRSDRRGERSADGEALFDAADGGVDGDRFIGEANGVAGGDEPVEPFFCGDHGGVAAAAEVVADLAEGGGGVFAREPHGEHAGLAGMS